MLAAHLYASGSMLCSSVTRVVIAAVVQATVMLLDHDIRRPPPGASQREKAKFKSRITGRSRIHTDLGTRIQEDTSGLTVKEKLTLVMRTHRAHITSSDPKSGGVSCVRDFCTCGCNGQWSSDAGAVSHAPQDP
jgi:hypothetical protein